MTEPVILEQGLTAAEVLGPVAFHAGSRGVQQGQSVEGALGAVLLADADHDVEDGGQPEERVLPAPEEE
ncbi:hypothetical protein ACC691_38470, partial [Rhizobium johnstonii]|uniref:hypothetical protein n=1 Tax=Rhizobium johnstonii TaxID=3019933 RepID=UPI003F98E57C